MALTSLQVCMDSSSSDWLQGTSHEESAGMDTSSASAMSPTDVLGCSRPVSMERRLRPPHDQSLKCPRCESTHTKFCYYNNYSLTQPRYFCKTCRRYWTKGGTLRNIPVGGGCRKNKKPSSAPKKNDAVHHQLMIPDTTDLQLSFPNHPHHYLMPNEFMESKLEGIMGNQHHRASMINAGYDFMGGLMMMNMDSHADFHAPFGIMDGAADVAGPSSDACQSLIEGGFDVKPKLLSLDHWHQDHHQGSYNNNLGNGFGAWSSSGIFINNYGQSSNVATTTTPNPLL